MRWLRQKIFSLVLWISNKFASRPTKDKVFEGLSKIIQGIEKGDEKEGIVIPFEAAGRFIIFSDQHKGNGNYADDFRLCSTNYLAALDHYYNNNFQFIALGDCEELWENTLSEVLKQQTESFARYKKFIEINSFYKIIGNHDVDWKTTIMAAKIKEVYGTALPIYNGVLLQSSSNGQSLKILCAHGHQGDGAADGNWFSRFFVAKIWAPLQSILKINPNTPAYDSQLKTLHNRLMYEWSSEQKNLLLITGHTHQPVFESLTYIERLYRQLLTAQKDGDEKRTKEIEAEIVKRKFEYDHVSPDYLTMKPGYFNSGCCCYNDGDITGIEIDEGCLRLIKWAVKDSVPTRQVLEEEKLEVLLKGIS